MNYTMSALLLLCTVSFTGCVQKNDKEKGIKRSTAGTVIHINSEQEFDEITANGNVVVDFFAHWCGPCQKMGPIFDETAKEMPDTTFVKVDTEKFTDLSKRFGVRGLPTLMFFKNGKKIGQKTGLLTKAELRKEINKTYELV